jgi:hypothetical protein
VVLGLEACFKEVVTRSDYQNPTRLSEKVLLAKGARVDQVVSEVGTLCQLAEDNKRGCCGLIEEQRNKLNVRQEVTRLNLPAYYFGCLYTRIWATYD